MTASPAKPKSGSPLIQIAEVPVPAIRPCNSPGYFAGIDTEAEMRYNTLTQQGADMKAWDVIRNGRVIDTVFYDRDCELWYVRKGLIEHDGYPVDIIVKPAIR
jgi:hypothetical protein